jgi:soluble lytic murein transglycosylase-like protein
LIGITAAAAEAKDKDAKRYFVDCPVDTNIRVANARASERFAALSGCTAKIVHAPPAPLPADPSVARIVGVTDKDETPGERRARERAAREALKSSGTSYRVPISAYDKSIFRSAAAHRVDPLFLHAIIATESAHNPNAVSHVGARGLMQIMPATGSTLGVQKVALFNPAINVDAGARLLKRLQRRYGRNFDLILSAYNAGEGAVAKYGNRIPPYRETQNYVKKVMARYKGYRVAGSQR